MAMIRYVCFLFKLLLSPLIRRKSTPKLKIDKSGQDVSDLIKELLNSDKPVMISRFGSVELQCVIEFLSKVTIKNCIKYITGKSDYLGYYKSTRFAMSNNAGFFPVTKNNLDTFSILMLNSISSLDVLGSWQKSEYRLGAKLSNIIKVPLGDLEPYFHVNPWSEVLKGKKILVIHPFEETIREQYSKRELLFRDERILPEFDLQIIKSVQTIANSPSKYKTWFDALEYMKCEINKRDFDIAIIGCGAYGFPLAAHVKSIGKKSIHLGGATQMLFGIRSLSWDEEPKFHYLINEFWVRPKDSERPLNYKMVEGGRYW